MAAGKLRRQIVLLLRYQNRIEHRGIISLKRTFPYIRRG